MRAKNSHAWAPLMVYLPVLELVLFTFVIIFFSMKNSLFLPQKTHNFFKFSINMQHTTLKLKSFKIALAHTFGNPVKLFWENTHVYYFLGATKTRKV
jgi:hypothetical protein